jgi:hypothetical protein
MGTNFGLRENMWWNDFVGSESLSRVYERC